MTNERVGTVCAAVALAMLAACNSSAGRASASPSTATSPASTTLLGASTAASGGSVARLAVDAKELVASLRWSKDGASLYLLAKDGVVRRLAIPAYVEEARHAIGETGLALEVSSEGVVVLAGPATRGGTKELLVLDATTLAPKRAVTVPASAEGLGASPATSLAYVASRSFDETLWIVDLAAGRIARTLVARTVWANQSRAARLHPEGVVLSEFRFPTVTPDGRLFFCMGFECLHRFRVSGTDLVYEEMGPRIGQNAQRIEVSVDSQRVALPSGGGNSRYRGAPRLGYGTYVYGSKDLATPMVSIVSGAYPRALAFDVPGQRIYGQSYDRALIGFDRSGTRLVDYDLKALYRGQATVGETRQLLVEPSGAAVLVLTEDVLARVAR